MKADMLEVPIFGTPELNVQYTERRAAYLVVINDGLVAMVRSRQTHFLPGGGSNPGESMEETVMREVQEELAQGVRLLRRIGEAIQYFYSAADDRHYKMLATFFAGEFTGDAGESPGEHELEWIPLAMIEQACFHECHAWAARQDGTISLKFS
jgi:8-oxo-dGTP pyrophosphatase MutT (NUDIX family)